MIGLGLVAYPVKYEDCAQERFEEFEEQKREEIRFLKIAYSLDKENGLLKFEIT